MKRIVLILLIAIVLSGCMGEYASRCMADIRVGLYLDDVYEPGDYDSVIGNEAYLYIFRDGILADIQIIPYDKIRNGDQYTVKTTMTEGMVDLVVWAIPVGENQSLLPIYEIGDSFGEIFLELDLVNKENESQGFMPCSYKRYIGSVWSVDNTNSMVYNIGMRTAACRVEVNITDRLGVFASSETVPSIDIQGAMTKMNLKKSCSGINAIIHMTLTNLDTELTDFSSGRFGILPSLDGPLVAVDVFNGYNKIATLTVPRSNLPLGAQIGGLLIFDYVIGESHFTLTVDGFTQKIETIEQM